jgi:hypothetical protein
MLDACVVHEDVDGAERRLGAGDEVANLRGLGHVGAVVLDLHAVVAREPGAQTPRFAPRRRTR